MRVRELRAMWLGVAAATLLGVGCPVGGNAQAQRTARDTWQRVDDVVAALQVDEGDRIADVGAGSGFFTFRLSPRVGPNGRVIAEDVDRAVLARLRATAERRGLRNVETVVGETDDPRLPERSLDGVLIVNAYHEFYEHEPMLAGIRRALRPGGRLVILDMPRDSTLSRAAQMAEHGLAIGIAARDLVAAGFRVLSQDPDFIRNRQWMVVAVVAEPAAGVQPQGPSGGVVLEKGGQVFEFQNTNQIGLGDLDRDGDLDAVFSNMGPNDSRVWLNDGAGRFSDSRQVLTQQGHGVALGDLDGDGDLDAFMACASYGTDGVEHFRPSRVYINDGTGRLTDSGQDLGDSARSGNSVRVLDADRDGDLDALVVYYQEPDRLYLNDGRGRFADSGREMPEGANPADLDGDGDADLFLREEGRGFRVLLNDGAGRFAEHWARPDAALTYGVVALGDLDGDGDVDAVVTDGDMQVQRPTRVLVNDGAGRFTDSGQSLPAVRFGRVAVGDLSGDGAPDLGLTSRGEPFRVWVNDGRGRFSESGFVATGNRSPFGLVLGDLDGDGDLDLVIAGFVEGPVEIWWNRRR